MKPIKFEIILPKYHAILDRGLSFGLGNKDGQMCIEAAVCSALGLPHGDDPNCVATAVREFKIRLNDSNWSSPEARANGLRRLGIAQLGSKGIVNDITFVKRLSELTIRRLIPALFRQIFPNNQDCLKAATRCENEGTAKAVEAAARAAWEAREAAEAARAAQWSASAEWAAAEATWAAAAWAAAAWAAAEATWEVKAKTDKYLVMSANLAIEILAELHSPGVEWIDWRQT